MINLRSSIQREISVHSPALNPLGVSRNRSEKAAACRKYFKNVCHLRKKVVKDLGQGQPVNIPSGFIFFFLHSTNTENQGEHDGPLRVLK